MAYIAGMAATRDIRGALAGVGRRLRKGNLSDKELFELLRQQERLTEELKAVAVEVLERQISKAGKGKK